MPAPLGTLEALRDELAQGRVSARDLTQQALDRARALEPHLAAYVHFRDERALADADASDARRAAGEGLSPLDGVPIAIKDNIVQAGEPATCASRILEGYVSPFDATAVERLQRAGAVIIGRTNMDEFAMGSSTEHSVHGPSRNPWDPSRIPGGSSGGSAVAVASGSVPAALGSDTGGSIRQPSALCGVVGFKPTYGRVSRYGLVAFASSLDQIGPFTRTVRGCAWLTEIVAGHDPRDSTSAPEPVPALADALTGDVSDLVIGVPREVFDLPGADPEVLARARDAVAELERAGAKTCPVSLPHLKYAIATYYLVANAEASSNLARFDGVRYGRRAEGVEDLQSLYLRSRSEGFGDEVKRRILLGTYVLSAGYYDAYYRKAQQVRALLRRDYEQAFQQCDVIATPTTPETAFPIGAKTGDPLTMYLQDIYTVSVNLAGCPGISVPCGAVAGLPVGLHLIGRALDEPTLLRAADAYQRVTSFHAERPPEPVS